jgi:two-component system, NarL family, nitrate/nitrite response regulator NarL
MAKGRCHLTARVRLAVIDDHPLMRAGIEHSLGREEDFEIIASGASAADAIKIAMEHTPDVMLLDLNMPGGGLAAARSISANHPQIHIFILTVSERHEDVTDALSAGVRGYILKGISGPDLVRTMRSTTAGETYITPEFAARLLITHPTKRPGSMSTADAMQQLSAREEQVLKELSLGYTNKEIARKLDLTEKTVKHYMSGILHKLSVSNRVEAVVASRRMKDRH